MKVEMQTASTKIILSETADPGHHLAAGKTLQSVVHHEIKELGQHVLACTVTYRSPPNVRKVPGAAEDAGDPTLQTFRKFYKFAVTNPLSVKTKVHAARCPSALLSGEEREKIFLEVHIQNLTQQPMCFERMRFECADGWESEHGNLLRSEGVDNPKGIFSGPLALMQPQDIRQYVYILTTKTPTVAPTVHLPGNVIPLGRLDISWTSAFGEPGRLLTSMLSRRIPLPSVQQPVSALPPYLKRSTGQETSRPQSPQPFPSRPGTPPINRPGSPAHNRPSSTASVQPQSVAQTSAFGALPELDVHLSVCHVPRGSIISEKPFTVSFAVSILTTVPLHHRRRVRLAVQHIQPSRTTLLPNLPVGAEAFSPRLPSSGFSTPSSATASFNYALAHQKILAAAARTLLTGEGEPEHPDKEAFLLPPPFFESADELQNSHPRNVSFVGPSVVFLPFVELFPNNQSDHAIVANQDHGTTAEAIQKFELSYVPSYPGFTTFGGLRLLLLDDDTSEQSAENPTDNKRTKLRRAQSLKEYPVVAEVWVSPA